MISISNSDVGRDISLSISILSRSGKGLNTILDITNSYQASFSIYRYDDTDRLPIADPRADLHAPQVSAIAFALSDPWEIALMDRCKAGRFGSTRVPRSIWNSPLIGL